MISWLNHFSPVWLAWMTAMLWQSAILIAIVWLVDLALRRFVWPQFRYAIWLLVFVKLLLPPGFAMPTSLTSGLAPFIQHHLWAADSATPLPAVPDTETITKVVLPAAKHIATPTAGTAPVVTHATLPALSWESTLMLIWLAGIAMLSLWLCVKLWRLRSSAEAVSLPEWFPQAMRQAADRLGLRHIPAVIVTKQVKCPAVLGAIHPLILTPADRIGTYTRQDASNMLIHELAHIKRGDLLIHATQLVIQVVYWPNVLLWLVRRPIHDLRELCCDATVAATLRDETPAYRQTLLDTARILIAESADPGLGLLGLFERPHAIVTRLNYLEKPYGRQTMCKFMTAIALTAMLVCILPMSLTEAETAAVESDSDTYTVSSGTASGGGGSSGAAATTTTTKGTKSVTVTRTTGFASSDGKQNIDANAIEFRVVWTAGKDLLQDEVQAIKDGSSPLFLNKECAWVDVDPNATISPNWVTREGEDGIMEVLVSNRPAEILVPDGSWSIKSITVNAYPGDRKPDLGLEFDTKGSSAIRDLTGKNIGRPLAILVHGRVVSAPMVMSPIADKAMITGNFTVAQLNTLMQSMMVKTPVKIEAHVIVAPVATMEKLLKQVGAETSSAAPSTGMQSVAMAGGTNMAAMSSGPMPAGMGNSKLTDDMASSLLAALPNEPNTRVVSSPTILTSMGERAAISVGGQVNGAHEELLLKVTPLKARKDTITLQMEMTFSRTVNDATKDMTSTATILNVPVGKLAVVSAGGTSGSTTYMLIKATLQK
jgi:beta-lactamase regulating signal transducer with metallopeptidase domain